MKYFLFIFFALLPFISAAQFSAPITIDSSADPGSYVNITATDLDGDNFKDLILCFNYNRIVCYKNNSGNSFSFLSDIDNNVYRPLFVDSKDVDGDGFPDILLSADSLDYAKLYYYKNINGGTGWNKIIIDDSIDVTVVRSYWVDIDNDGDYDILSCQDLRVVIYENQSGIFSAAQVVASQSEFYNMVVNDFNGDGFKDFVVHSAHGVKLYSNNHNNTFTPTLIINQLQGLLETCDIDNDNDYDLIFPDSNGLSSATYKNDGTGNFTNFQQVQYEVLGQNPPLAFANMNNDNSIDAVYAPNTGSSVIRKGIYINYNDGTGALNNEQIIDTSTYRSVYCVDMDNDGDNDIIWTRIGEGFSFGYIRNNNLINGIYSFVKDNSQKIYPNPSTGIFHINTTDPICNYKVFSVDGKFILSGEGKEINLSRYEKGIYIVKINTGNKLFTLKIVLAG